MPFSRLEQGHVCAADRQGWNYVMRQKSRPDAAEPSGRRYEASSAIKAPVRRTNAKRTNKAPVWPIYCAARMHVAPFAKVDRRIKDDLIARVDPRVHFHFRAEVPGLSHLADLRADSRAHERMSHRILTKVTSFYADLALLAWCSVDNFRPMTSSTAPSRDEATPSNSGETNKPRPARSFGRDYEQRLRQFDDKTVC